MFDMTAENFLNNTDMDVFTFGRPPAAIDIMTAIKGAEFGVLYDKAIDIEIEEIKVKTVQLNQLIELKKASGRFKDMDDIEKLSEL
jgi:hypothetical protein